MSFINYNEITGAQIKQFQARRPLFKDLDDPKKLMDDPEFAAIGARFAFSSYREAPIKGLNGRKIDPIKGDTPRIFAYTLPDCLVLSFRGTATKTDAIRDLWLTSITCGSIGGAKVHTGGFIHAMECLLMCMKEIIDNPTKKLVLTGSSLGAGVAKVLARCLILNKIVKEEHIRVMLYSTPSSSIGGANARVKGMAYVNTKDKLVNFSREFYRSKSISNTHTSRIDELDLFHNTYLVAGTYVSGKDLPELQKIVIA